MTIRLNNDSQAAIVKITRTAFSVQIRIRDFSDTKDIAILAMGYDQFIEFIAELQEVQEDFFDFESTKFQ